MDPQFWKNKWKAGETRFHLDRPHPQLVKHFSHISTGKVMVPLCGKSNDLLWLRSKGHEVVGIELSELACDAFFHENKIAHQKTSVDGAIKYESDGITLWCADYFKVSPSVWKGCTAVYDRAALIALPEDLRQKYVKHLLEVWGEQTPKESSILLITIEYENEKMKGPPFSVSEKEIESLYGEFFNIQKLAEETDQISTIDVLERAHWLARR